MDPNKNESLNVNVNVHIDTNENKNSIMHCSYAITVTVNTASMVTKCAKVEIGSEPIHCINVCFAIDKMINFDGDANADVKCKVAFSPRGTHERRWVFPPSCPSRCSSRDTRTCSRQSCSVPRYTRCLETGLRTGLRHKHLKIRRHQCNSRDTGWFMTSLMYLTGVASN